MTDWVSIQARYEAGEGFADISNSLGGKPTRQAIQQKCRKGGWTRQVIPVDGTLLSTAQLPQNMLEDLRPEQIAVLREMCRGASQNTAAAMVGVGKSTVSGWLKASERYERASEAAKAVKTLRRLDKVDLDPTWKSAAWLLQHDPDSKGDYANEAGKGNLVGNTFNVLGRIDLGIERPPLTAPEPVTEG